MYVEGSQRTPEPLFLVKHTHLGFVQIYVCVRVRTVAEVGVGVGGHLFAHTEARGKRQTVHSITLPAHSSVQDLLSLNLDLMLFLTKMEATKP